MWVVLVDCGRPLYGIGLSPGKATGQLGIKPNFLRIEDGMLAPDELLGGRPFLPSCRNALSAALQTSGHSLGPGGVRARERAGEHALASEADLERRAKSALPALICMGLAWVGLAVATAIFNGFEHVSVLERMGALDPRRVWWHGEWWRLLTATYLHANLKHLWSNVAAGAVFGVEVAASLGPWRTLALFQASALAGSALALFTSRSIGVGASGGLFGLLGAFMVLAKLGGGFVPLRLRRGRWLLGLVMLGINVLVSFRSEVSFAAHAGGFVAGVALSASGAILVGLPPLDSPPGTVERYKGAFRAFVLGVAVLSGAGFAICWSRYSPWDPR
jgi:membrane associated rhomboid family serine protease